MRAWRSLKVVRSPKLLFCQALVLSPLCLENQLPQCPAGKGVIRAWDQVIWWVLFSDLAERRWRRLRCAGFTQVGHSLLFVSLLAYSRAVTVSSAALNLLYFTACTTMHRSRTRPCPVETATSWQSLGLDSVPPQAISPPTARGTWEEPRCEQAVFFYWVSLPPCRPSLWEWAGVCGRARTRTAALALGGACVGRTRAHPLRWLQGDGQHPTVSKSGKKG